MRESGVVCSRREKSQCKCPEAGVRGEEEHACCVPGPARSPLWVDRESLVGDSSREVSI